MDDDQNKLSNDAIFRTQSSTTPTEPIDAKPNVNHDDQNMGDKIKESTLGKGLSAIGTGLGSALKFVKKNTIDKATDAIDKSNKLKEVNKFFESKATTFFIDDKTIYGIKELNSNVLIFRCTDANYLGAGIEIKFDKQVLEITDIDKKNTFKFTYDDKEHDLLCFKAISKVRERFNAPETIINNVVNTVNLAENASITGDINQVTQINIDLNKLNAAINDFKPSFLGRGKKEQSEARQLFVGFKSCILNEKPKDKTLLDRFLGALSVIAPAFVAVAKSLWG